MQGLTRMVRGRRPWKTGTCVSCGRLCSNASGETAGSNQSKDSQHFRLWAMERASKSSYKARLANKKAWRIPGLIDYMFDGMPEGVGPNLYLDRLQVHQFYWKLGEIGFICTPFQLDIYEQDWEKSFEKAKLLTSLEVYPHLVNKTDADEIVNIVFVSPKQWGKRCLIQYCGEQDCIGLKNGGIVKKNLHYVALDCDLHTTIPDIIVDLSKLDIGNEICIEHLNLDVKVMRNLSLATPVCKILSQESPQRRDSALQ